jgi:uncharacterized protein (TIGR02453 family)
MSVSPEFFAFFEALTKHNDRAWFQKHTDRYEAHVKVPFDELLDAVAPIFAKHTPFIVDRPKAMRVHRDVRFSKDKSPYKTHAGAMLLHRTQKRGPGMLGFFLRLGPEESLLGAGVSEPGPPDLLAIRRAIVADPTGWKAVRKRLQGDGLKRVPEGFPADHPFADDLRRKSFFRTVPFSRAQVASKRFVSDVERAVVELEPLLGFLASAMKLRW